MPSKLKLVLTAAIVAVGLAGAPALYAHDSQGSSGSMMGMGQGNMMGGGMMGTMNMMSNMMSGNGQMAQGCSQMMQGMKGDHGAQRPNEQWQPNQTPNKGK